MREIEFRGKDAQTNEWVFGGFTLDVADNPRITTKTNSGLGLEFHNIIPETVGQYTGREDRNGKPIYEGDIIERTGWKDCGYRIFYNPVHCAFLGVALEDGIGTLPLGKIESSLIEIIGNIHDDLELPKKVNLKPCPFCGKKPVRYNHDKGFHTYAIKCPNAGCAAFYTALYATEAEAIVAWNKRIREEKE